LYKARVVRFFYHRELMCGVCLDEKNNRLKILCQDSRQIVLNINRIVHFCTRVLNLKLSKEKLLEELSGIVKRQRGFMEQVKVNDLWEFLDDKNCLYKISTLTGIVFGDDIDLDHEAAVILAVLKDRVYFKLKGSMLLAHSPEQIERLKCRIASEEKQRLFVQETIDWLKTIEHGGECCLDGRDDAIEVLKNYVIFGSDASPAAIIKEIVKKTGISDQKQCFDMLVSLGVWDSDENLAVYRHRIPYSWSSNIQTFVTSSEPEKAYKTIFDEARQDFTGKEIYSIDDTFTRDIDDAISFDFHDDCVEVCIHITDVSPVIHRSDIIDRQAAARAVSLYFPEGKISMLPCELSEDLLSLKHGEIRPTLSFAVKLSSSGELIDYRILSGFVKVTKRLSYEDADRLISSDPDFSRMYDTACQLRRNRIENGAVAAMIPELQVSVDKEKHVHLKLRDREMQSQTLVSECMILANYCLSLFCREHNIPALYRKQKQSDTKLENGDNQSIFQLFARKKHFSRVETGVIPGSHGSLGLSSYTSVTSPMRKYLDLVMQRQVISFLKCGNPAYSQDELEKILCNVQPVLARAALTAQERKRYWVLKVLKNMVGELFQAIVLDVRFGRCTVLLSDYLLEANIKKPEDIEVASGETVSVMLEKADPFYGIFKVSFIKP